MHVIGGYHKGAPRALVELRAPRGGYVTACFGLIRGSLEVLRNVCMQDVKNVDSDARSLGFARCTALAFGASLAPPEPATRL